MDTSVTEAAYSVLLEKGNCFPLHQLWHTTQLVWQRKVCNTKVMPICKLGRERKMLKLLTVVIEQTQRRCLCLYLMDFCLKANSKLFYLN